MFPITVTKIDQRWAPEYLQPNEAVKAQHLDTSSQLGAIKRSRGLVRPNFTSGQFYTVVACGHFVRKDGALVLLYQTTAGAVEVAYRVEPNWLDADY